MSESAFRLECLRDPRLSVQATHSLPAWLWAPDGTRVLWANAAGAALLDSRDVAELAARRFTREHPLRRQIEKLGDTLFRGAAPRLERLRGLAAGIGRPLTCACSRIALGDKTQGLLVVSSERAGPELSLAERVRRLFAGIVQPVAVFAPDGALLHATPAAQDRLSGERMLAALGGLTLAAEAMRAGHASGVMKGAPVTIDRFGDERAPLLLARFEEAPAAEPRAPASSDSETAAASGTAAGEPIESAPAIAAIEMHADAAIERGAPGAEPVASEPPASAEPLASPEPVTAAEPRTSAEPLASAESLGGGEFPEPADAHERRHPLRFAWEMDAQHNFTLGSFEGSAEFAHLIGPRAVAMLGKPWDEITHALGLDPNGHVAQAVASCETWSGIALVWPLEGTEEKIEVELSGLPVFDRERIFRGYRGFGVCREIERLAELARLREPAPPVADDDSEAAPAAAPQAGEDDEADARHTSRPVPPASVGEERPVLTIVPQARNVVPFRPAGGDAKTPSLSPVERKAFRELARQLSARLGTAGISDSAAHDRDEATAPPTEGAAALAAADDQISREIPAAAGSAAESDEHSAPDDFGRNEEAAAAAAARSDSAAARAILDHVPSGVLIYRINHLLYANGAFLACTGYDSLDALIAAGGLDSLFVDQAPSEHAGGSRPLTISSGRGGTVPVAARLFTVPWEGEQALMLIATPAAPDHGATEAALRTAQGRVRELEKAELEVVKSMRRAEQASAAKSEFLAKISHEIRTPLNAIIGFAEVMMEERFGPVGNDRYREYLRDIHASGGHLISLLNDLLDLSKIEAGKLELSFTQFNLNELTQQCVAIMQSQAHRARIIIRTALSPKLPPVSADERSVRQIVLNLLSNSIKFTNVGGQVIVSTALADAGEVVLRVRDTGVGMSEKDIATALEPFRQLATSARSGGTGLGLPLTKALAEANRARFHIASAPNSGTLVEVAFPARRASAE